ncbi:DUF1642 domain-containing protein [Streptococcus uberis]|uniref:DUF1642 domain-containing protein n=1 Tax=Streptococcus uberis TaxID=1349 RepID=UPI0020BE3C37|nr:DUF1642 domain-containing protein [Streptococcus uberis]
MIKLTREQDEVVGSFNKFNSITAKSFMIELLFKANGMLAETFKTDEEKLKAIQAILDGKWEVEEEPLYYVRNNKGVALLRKVNGEVETSLPFADFFFDDNKKDFQLTKHEVASYDPRYLEFLEEVE